MSSSTEFNIAVIDFLSDSLPCNQKVCSYFMEMLLSSEPIVRIKSLQYLSYLYDKCDNFTKIANNMFYDNDPKVRIAVIQELSKINSKYLHSVIGELYRNEDNSAVRSSLIEATHYYSGEGIDDLRLLAIMDKSINVRVQSILSLCKSNNFTSIYALLYAVNDSNHTVREYALYSLRKYKLSFVLPVILRLAYKNIGDVTIYKNIFNINNT